MAEVVPFPLHRRVGYIRRQARRLTDLSAKGAESTLWHQLQMQRDRLLAKGADPARVEAEVKALEVAIRCAIWRLVLTGEAG